MQFQSDRKRHRVPCHLGLLFAIIASFEIRATEPEAVKPVQALHHDLVGDQDDLCFWRHPHDSSKSLVIASDKKANRIFSYDLTGKLVQSIELNKPGNIDIRQNVRLSGKVLDLVVVNVRAGQPALRVFSVDSNGVMTGIDDQGISTRPNYGGCLGYSNKDEKLWYYCTSEEAGVTQYEIGLTDHNMVAGREVRHWELGKCEGAVADDEALTLFVAVEDEGIWRFGMLPEDPVGGEKIVSIGDNGIKADLEGMCLAKFPDSTPVFIVSAQGADQFFVYERSSPHNFRGTFRIDGATGTDGIDLIQLDGLSGFEGGIFGCHTDAGKHPVLLAPWIDVWKSFAERSAVKWSFALNTLPRFARKSQCVPPTNGTVRLA